MICEVDIMIYSLAFALLCTWSDFACWVFKKNHLLSIMFHIVIKDTSLWFSGKMVLSFWITIKKDCWAILHLQTVNFIKQWEVFWSLLKQTLCQFWVSSWQWTFVTVKHNKFIKYDKSVLFLFIISFKPCCHVELQIVSSFSIFQHFKPHHPFAIILF